MSILPNTASRTTALTANERRPCTVLEIDMDKCTNRYGVAPCTAIGAVGTECYNTYGTCQSKTNYSKGVQTLKFISRGALVPPGETLRPYISNETNAPTVIDPEAGLAVRALITLQMIDEPDSDIQTDPYYATRPTPAGGTFWVRFLARNYNYAGRAARVRRGFVVSPWDWTTFLTELYMIDSIAGPDSSGLVTLNLKDPLKLTDRALIPAATSGVLASDCLATAYAGTAVSATSTTMVLDSNASAVDSTYNGMEVHILANLGSGQRRTITAYVGATRTCTVAIWSVTPNGTSTYEIGPLSMNVGTGKGVQYTDPATSGKNEYVRISNEIIRYTAKAGDVLSWPDTSYRAQFGTVRADHKTNDGVQLCRAYINQPALTGVCKSLLNESGITDANIDTALFTSEDATWLGANYLITGVVSKPEKASGMIAEILVQTGSVMWFSAQEQLTKVKVLTPRSATPPSWTDEATFIGGSVALTILETLRITRAGIYYNLTNATANLTQSTSYGLGEINIDVSAESPNEYNDSRPDVQYSRWFGFGNQIAMSNQMVRRLAARRDAPKMVAFKIDPKDYTLPVGELVDVTTRRIAGVNGQNEKTRVLITKIVDKSTHIEIEARNTQFAGRYAYIAPPGTANFPTDTHYGHFAGALGSMSDGSFPYLMI